MNYYTVRVCVHCETEKGLGGQSGATRHGVRTECVPRVELTGQLAKCGPVGECVLYNWCSRSPPAVQPCW
jgi:hypothetical protein